LLYQSSILIRFKYYFFCLHIQTSEMKKKILDVIIISVMRDVSNKGNSDAFDYQFPGA
jgi:hypothetical protein